jgi:hypothetical protein
MLMKITCFVSAPRQRPRLESEAVTRDDLIELIKSGYALDVSAETIVDKLLAAQQDGGWQPIETAPKDGTWVDLWVRDWNDNGKRIPFCIWDDDKWLTSVFPNDYGPLSECVNTFVKDDEWKPTHWRPIPAPPQT